MDRGAHWEGGMMMVQGGGLVWLLVMALVLVVPFWKILPKAGISPWLSLLAVIPFVALILLWVVAFSRWPGEAGNRGV